MTNVAPKTAPRMTGEDFRRLAREAGEEAVQLQDGTAPPETIYHLAEQVQRLASALCEADARLSHMLTAFDPTDPTTPVGVTHLAMVHLGLSAWTAATCREHAAYEPWCRACVGASYVRLFNSLPPCPSKSFTRPCIIRGEHDIHDDGDGMRWTADHNEGARGVLCKLLCRLGGDGITEHHNAVGAQALEDEIYQHVLWMERRERENVRDKCADIAGDFDPNSEHPREGIAAAISALDFAPKAFTVPTEPIPPGVYHNCADPCGVGGCKGGLRIGGVVLMGKP